MSPETIILIAVYVMLCVATLCGVLYALPKIWLAWWNAKYAVDRTRRWIREEREHDDR